MLVFAAITPHSPLLINEIGKDNAAKLQATIAGLKELEGILYAAQADALIVIVPNADTEQTSFVINFAPVFHGSFAEFGDFNDKPAYYGGNSLAYRIKESLETRFPVKLTTMEELDYSSLVPLHYLLAHKKPTPVVPILSARRTLAEHFAFGQAMAEEIMETAARVAVIASAETSHVLSKLSPAGYQQGAKRFDQKTVRLITERNIPELLAYQAADLEKYGLNELPAIMTLLGILSERRCRARLLARESPFGIGHLTMEFEL